MSETPRLPDPKPLCVEHMTALDVAMACALWLGQQGRVPTGHYTIRAEVFADCSVALTFWSTKPETP